MSVPSFKWKVDFFAGYKEDANLCNRIATLGASKSGPAFVLQVAPRAREICMAPGNRESISAGGVTGNLEGLKNVYATFALDAVYQDVLKFLRLREDAETMDAYSRNLTFCDG